jgi:hypothetical protein
MRAARKFKDALNRSTFIFTLASINQCGDQALVSVAKVTEHFPDMTAYAKHIIKVQPLRDSRLTRVRNGSSQFMRRRFGDCHADGFARIGSPLPGHVHYRTSEWKKDLNFGHEILLSNRFLVWLKPAFTSKTTLKQGRFGVSVDPSNLSDWLGEIRSNPF